MRRSEYLTQSCDVATLTACQAMEGAIYTCNPKTSGFTVAQMLTEHNFGSVPVVEDDRTLVGLVSEFDLLKAMTAGKDLRQVTADDIMTREVVTVREEAPIMEVIRLLQEHHLIRVPVVRERKLVGIVARRDILFGYVRAVAHYWYP